MASKLNVIRGIACWPKLNEPDFKFNAAGVYSVRLRVDEATAQPWIDKTDEVVEELRQEAYEQAKKDPKNKKLTLGDIRIADKSIVPELDEEGDETGFYLMNFKMKASGKSKKTGKEWTRRPLVVDSKKRPVDLDEVNIWSGSEISVAFDTWPFYTVKVGAGLSLRLEMVQIHKLVEGSGDTSCFDEDEDGWTADDEAQARKERPKVDDDSDDPFSESDSSEDDDDYDF